MASAPSDADPALLDQLRELGATHGPLMVALAAVKLSDPRAVVRAVMDPRRADEFFDSAAADPVTPHPATPRVSEQLHQAIQDMNVRYTCPAPSLEQGA